MNYVFDKINEIKNTKEEKHKYLSSSQQQINWDKVAYQIAVVLSKSDAFFGEILCQTIKILFIIHDRTLFLRRYF